MLQVLVRIKVSYCMWLMNISECSAISIFKIFNKRKQLLLPTLIRIIRTNGLNKCASDDKPIKPVRNFHGIIVIFYAETDQFRILLHIVLHPADEALN